MGKKAYHMGNAERTQQKGYHANTANKIITQNQKNKTKNQKNAEKTRQALNKAATEKAAASHKSTKHHGHFQFYVH